MVARHYETLACVPGVDGQIKWAAAYRCYLRCMGETYLGLNRIAATCAHDGGIHKIDVLLYLAGRPRDVYARALPRV